ncbi:MAG: hypothetical protein V4458_18740 [Pseudomonadota bacterium]
MENVDGNDAGNEANKPGEQNEPPVVFGGQASQNAEHGIRPRCSPDEYPISLSLLLTSYN